MLEESDSRLYYAHVARNREAILEVLRRVLPPQGLVLEVASGSGEHAAYFAKMLPTLLWQPTDPDPRALASIATHRTAADAPNLLSPLWLDAMSEQWPVQRADPAVKSRSRRFWRKSAPLCVRHETHLRLPRYLRQQSPERGIRFWGSGT
jgi:hypothetical protein